MHHTKYIRMFKHRLLLCIGYIIFLDLPIIIALQFPTPAHIGRPAMKRASENKTISEIHGNGFHAEFAKELNHALFLRVADDALFIDVQRVHGEPVGTVQVICK